MTSILSLQRDVDVEIIVGTGFQFLLGRRTGRNWVGWSGNGTFAQQKMMVLTPKMGMKLEKMRYVGIYDIRLFHGNIWDNYYQKNTYYLIQKLVKYPQFMAWIVWITAFVVYSQSPAAQLGS